MNYKLELEKIYNTRVPNFTNEFLNREIVLYGAGSLGKMGLDLLNKEGIKPKYIVDKFTKGELGGIPILNPDEVSNNDKKNCLFLVCISTLSYNEISEYLKNLSIKHIIQFYTYAYIKFPQLMTNGWTKYNLTENDKINIEKVCKILSNDELSIHHYLQFLWWKLRGIENVFEKFPILSKKKYFGSPSIRKLTKEEVLLDCGCHFGQTIEAFDKATDGQFLKINAIEPDAENLSICKGKIRDKRIEYLQAAVSNFDGEENFIDGLGYASKLNIKGDKKVRVIKIDSLNIKPTIIKIHIEGEELKALQGATETLKGCKPMLMVLADHSEDGLYKIPLLMYDFGYKNVKFNLHDYCGNSAVYYGNN